MQIEVNESIIRSLRYLDTILENGGQAAAQGFASVRRNPAVAAQYHAKCLDYFRDARKALFDAMVEMLPTSSSPPETTPDQPCGCRSFDDDE